MGLIPPQRRFESRVEGFDPLGRKNTTPLGQNRWAYFPRTRTWVPAEGPMLGAFQCRYSATR